MALVAVGSDTAWASPPVTTLVGFNPSLGELPESLTADDAGNIYMSVGGTVRKFSTDHVLSTVATVPIPAGAFTVGIKTGPDGSIYIASGGLTPAPAAAFIWRVSQTGEAKVFATLPPDSFPNDLAFDERGHLYVTDSFAGIVWKIDAHGNPSIWLQDPLLLGNPSAPVAIFHAFGVNGIALDHPRHVMYLGNTDFGRIMRVRIRDGSAAGIDVIVADDTLKGADGIALDARGRLYVAVNALDRIATVDDHGNIATFVQGYPPLDAPSSLVFGTGPGDRHTLYLTSFALFRANGFLPGTPMPALQSVPVRIGGLDLDEP